jgi:hypothetical protein
MYICIYTIIHIIDIILMDDHYHPSLSLFSFSHTHTHTHTHTHIHTHTGTHMHTDTERDKHHYMIGDPFSLQKETLSVVNNSTMKR